MRVEECEERICIAVSDTGQGIPRDQQGKTFSKFFRASNVVNDDTEGSGLGLSLVYLLVTILGGTITFTSQQRRGHRIPAPPAYRLGPHMSKRILLVEDEILLRDMMTMLLHDGGADVIVATNGKEAMEILARESPDLMLLDILMPKADGYEVLRYRKEQGMTFPVIILSNLSDPHEEENTRELGAVDFLVKSNVDEDELWKRVEEYL